MIISSNSSADARCLFVSFDLLLVVSLPHHSMIAQMLIMMMMMRRVLLLVKSRLRYYKLLWLVLSVLVICAPFVSFDLLLLVSLLHHSHRCS